MKKVIVTGAGGQLGKTLMELYSQSSAFQFEFMTSEQLDITNRERLDILFSNDQYDFCINCAAFTNVEQAEKTPERAFEVNAEGVKNVALLCKKHHIALVHISTDYVFDGEKRSPYTVQDTPNPINEYGKSKLKGEEYIREILTDQYIIRTSWLYSKKFGHNFYRTILKKAMEGAELRVTDNQTGRPTDTEALARFIMEEILADKKPFGTYHFSDGQPTTWYGFAQRILEENGLTDKVTLVLDRNYRTFAKRPKNSVLG